jgi:hypothetical protein
LRLNGRGATLADLQSVTDLSKADVELLKKLA